MYDYDVGDKVVCVDDAFKPAIAAFYLNLPEAGRTYVVREMRLGIAPGGGGEVSVTLVGVVNPASSAKPYRERGFAAWRFRKPGELPPVHEGDRRVRHGKIEVTA